ncbi:MAG: hypothetical protein K9M96_14435 [Deltaproteobacteria bacterium]|nr:hypothetical protein [Deltaproteobacteria bacterium]
MAVGWLGLIGLPFVGVVIGKVIDLWITAYLDKRKEIRDNADILLRYIIEYGELIELYRFYVTYSGKRLDNGTINESVLEPESKYRESIQRLKGVDLKETIIDKTVKIRLAGPEENVISTNLDRTGDLKDEIKNLYIKCRISPESILDIIQKLNKGDISYNFFQMMQQTVAEADQQYQQVRKYIDQYRYVNLINYITFRYFGRRLHH